MKRPPVTSTLLAAACLALGAGASASNTGFALNVDLHAQDGENAPNLLSPPYYYFPNGNVMEPQFAHDLVGEFPAATSFARVNPETGLIETWDRLLGTWLGYDFPLEEALGLAISVESGGQERFVGSHDDAFGGILFRAAPGRAETTHLVAPPYHTQWDTADDLLDATFDGIHRLTVATWRAGKLLERTIRPGPTYAGTDFGLVPQEALLLTVIADTHFLSPHYASEPRRDPPPDPGMLVGVTRFLDVHHTEGGRVDDADDGTPADGSAWRAASLVGATVYVTSGYEGEGTVGAFEPGFWWGQVGDGLALASHGLYHLRIGDDRLVVVDREVGSGAESRGYYAVTNKDVSEQHPDPFPPMVLRPIPVPATTVLASGDVLLEWASAVEDPGLPLRQNILGYGIFRARSGGGLERIGKVSASTTRFIDREASLLDGNRYAIGLIYRFGLRSTYLSGTSPCVGACGIVRGTGVIRTGTPLPGTVAGTGD